MKMSVKVVDDLDEAISHVNETSTGHSEAIITNDIVSADRFAREVDAAAVLVKRRPVSSTVRSSGSGPRSGSRPKAPRSRPDGSRAADHGEIRRSRHRPDP